MIISNDQIIYQDNADKVNTMKRSGTFNTNSYLNPNRNQKVKPLSAPTTMPFKQVTTKPITNKPAKKPSKVKPPEQWDIVSQTRNLAIKAMAGN
jgi:hypothetical protein